ncbi:pur operon repressor [Oceanobacillus kimchii]|uniref:Pur operon repressor n=1 Tax=Oceanobacillus kimchii TaxID=746691 RepID=A0ABQ5TGK3_9BACI|nr:MULTISPECIES: pur operon repressor [Oceanobacillus]MCT1577249.1 pur operon repressor [Oceanobacillus kimchii]MCT2135319.1 pur operon repressor [Oceanobacillus kimchii]OEH56583.1 transcriptional regulator [Oceanobacillus sp. E9]GLO64270.1 pur operon repressor [Oceanobacillus kimchii]
MKRSNRLVVLTDYFLENPRKHIKLTHFVELCNTTKSSISEDLDIIHDVFQQQGMGYLQRTTGAGGGVHYIPEFTSEKSEAFITELQRQLEDPVRILPGGYLYMSDILGDPKMVREIGRVFASRFSNLEIDAIVTVATKGIPLAYAVASFLSVPVVIARRDPKVTEGSSVSINYVSGSSRKIQTMVLPKRSLKEGSNVCIIDDFMMAGGTIAGIKSLLEEFNATVKAIGVLAEAEDEEERIVNDYTSLIKISHVDLQNNTITILPGNYNN